MAIRARSRSARAVPFVSLLKSVDSVVCSGGTMLREAAYLGIPAYSIFQSEIGAVDRWLESIGRARLIERPEDVSCIKLKHRGPIDLLDSNPNLLSELASAVVPGSGDRPRERHRSDAAPVTPIRRFCGVSKASALGDRHRR